jgi:hypothetical protein
MSPVGTKRKSRFETEPYSMHPRITPFVLREAAAYVSVISVAVRKLRAVPTSSEVKP